MDTQLLLAVLTGIGLLIFLILRLKLSAFLALLIVCMVVGILAGMPTEAIIESIQEGMGGTLGFVATVVGLGALFGGILEHSGGAKSLAEYLLSRSGQGRASWAMMFTGFLVAIPVFFDVAFIILVPVAYALSRRTGKSLLLYALPLLAGLAVTHAFVPPTPGPIAVADILGADLGWVILMGCAAGLPAACLGGPVFAKFMSKNMVVKPLDLDQEEDPAVSPRPGIIFTLIAVPIVLIVISTLVKSTEGMAPGAGVIHLLGHPFTALIIANLLAWYYLGIRKGYSSAELLKVGNKSFQAVGVIILLTGAGGAFKQILIDTGIGALLAENLDQSLLNPVLFGFLVAGLVRVLQGSSTVAMITAAGITAPVLAAGVYSAPQTAVVVIAIAAGATVLSHVNDSGFWLVGKFLNLSEKQTFASWTLMTSIIGVVGLVIAQAIWWLL